MTRTRRRPAIKKPAKRAKPPRRQPVPRLPRRQLTLPAGYRADGSVATLRDVLSPGVPTIDAGDLTEDDRARLTLLRIAAQPALALVGPGFVFDKARALEEVRQGTPLGRILVAVEHRTIEWLRETAAVQRHRREQAYRARKRRRTSARKAPRPRH